MKCCVESNNATLTSSQSTTQKPIKTTNAPAPVTKPTHKVEKPIQSESSKSKGMPHATIQFSLFGLNIEI